MEFNDRIQTKKGNLGEKIVIDLLEKAGYIVYKCISETSHPFDFLACKEGRFVIIEIKTKARMNKFEATGFDVKHLSKYKQASEELKINVIIFFVDEHPKEQRIYYQKLSELLKEKCINGINYPNTEIAKGIILFSLQDMIEVKKLSYEEIEAIKKNNSRNYDYY